MSFHIKHIMIDNHLTHRGQVMHICNSKVTIIGSDNGLLPAQHQATIWISGGILLIGPLGTNFSEILIEIHTFPFRKMHLKCHLWKGDHFAPASMWQSITGCHNGITCPDSKVRVAHMGPTWGRQDPGGPHVGPMNLATRVEPWLYNVMHFCIFRCNWFDFIASILTADEVLHTSRCW